jgi:hypothetical protein
MRANIDQTEPASWSSVQGLDVERRSRRRLSLALPVVLIRPGTETPIEAMMENVSSNGFYCLSDQEFSPDERLNCEICLPGDEVTSVPEPGLRLNCEVRVVRVVPRGSQGFGVACHFDEYSVKRSAID